MDINEFVEKHAAIGQSAWFHKDEVKQIVRDAIKATFKASVSNDILKRGRSDRSNAKAAKG